MKYATALLLLTALLLAGCGQKGPLYLPANESAPQTAPDTQTQADQSGQAGQGAAPDASTAEQP